MSFNSKLFPFFFAGVVAIYFVLPYRHRWKLLLAGSYVFYMCWQPVYVFWLLALTLLDYFCALRMGKARTRPGRLPWLLVSLTGNLLLLFIFKYSSFCNETIRALAGVAQLPYDVPAFNVLIPLGISFHTLQTIGYSIDVYRGTREPEKHLGHFALYVAFFPQLVAGPIERSTSLLPQFKRRNDFKYQRVVDGLRLMLWGIFKKLVIADRLAIFVNAVYSRPSAYGALSTMIATYFFAFQIYCDFSGYSDVAVGSAKVLGYDLMKNFRSPYFAQDIQDFWRRWHISLSTWFRDYLYLPLGGRRVARELWLRNILIVFLISGLWHGANWTFCVWGLLHGVYYAAFTLTRSTRQRLVQFLGLPQSPGISKALKIIVTFNLVAFAWIFFRASSLPDALQLISNLGGLGPSDGVPTSPFVVVGVKGLLFDCLLILGLVATEAKLKGEAIERYWSSRRLAWRWAVSYCLILAILALGTISKNEFIYFQF